MNKRSRTLKRQKGSRYILKTVLIVCEDSKSSPEYFEFIKSKFKLGVRTKVEGKSASAPIRVVEYAVHLKNRGDFDYVFCVFDTDTHQTIDKAIERARSKGLHVILSNPCFEYWYILHFKKISPSFTYSSEVIDKLKKYYPNYTKSANRQFFETIWPKTDQAILYSRKIITDQYHDREDIRHCNPSTHVYMVIEKLRDIATMTNK